MEIQPFWSLQRPRLADILKKTTEPSEKKRRKRVRRPKRDSRYEEGAATTTIGTQSDRYSLKVSMERAERQCLAERDFIRKCTDNQRTEMEEEILIEQSMKRLSIQDQLDMERDQDVKLFKALERRFGSIPEDIFTASRFPGRAFRFMVERSSRGIQRAFLAHSIRKLGQANFAAAKIQGVFRVFAAKTLLQRRRRDQFVLSTRCRLSVSRYEFKRLMQSFAAWKQYVQQRRHVNKILSQRRRRMQVGVFLEWKDYVECVRVRRTRQVIAFRAMQTNKLLERVFQAWKFLRSSY